MPVPGQDRRAVGELAFEVWIDDLADLQLLAVLFDLLQGLERGQIVSAFCNCGVFPRLVALASRICRRPV